MTITEGLRAHLLGDTAIAALVGTRVYPLRLPQKPTLPAIVLQKISQIRWGHLRGQGSLARPRFQVDSWATTHDGASTLAALCRRRLEGYQGVWSDGGSPAVSARVKVFFDTDMDLFEEDIQGGLCRNSADYFIYHQTAEGVL